MQGMRHRLAHGYYRVNLDIVWVTVQRDVPRLLAQAKALLSAGADRPPSVSGPAGEQ